MVNQWISILLVCSRGNDLRQREEALRAQLQELTSIQNRAVQALQGASAAGTSAPAAAISAPPPAATAAPSAPAAAVAAAPAVPAQPVAQAGPSTAATATPAGTGTRSPPQPALFRTPAAPPMADAARGMAQVLEGGARTGRITSAMFGSAIQAALAAATQVDADAFYSTIHNLALMYKPAICLCVTVCISLLHLQICSSLQHCEPLCTCEPSWHSSCSLCDTSAMLQMSPYTCHVAATIK